MMCPGQDPGFFRIQLVERPGSAVYRHSASKTPVNALTALHRVGGKAYNFFVAPLSTCS
jgi:hypothetical protein